MAKKSNAASEGALGELHNTLAKVLTDAVKSDGVSASVLAVAANFLKHNNITCAPSESNAVGALQEALERQGEPDAAADSDLQDALDGVLDLEAYRASR